MSEDQTNECTDADEAQPDWSQFSRRLASFGLGETPDPLLTRVPLPAKPAEQRRHNGDRSRRP